MAPNKLVLAILFQAVYGHRRIVTTADQMISENASAQRVAESLDSTRNIEEAAEENNIEDVEGAMLDAEEDEKEDVEAAEGNDDEYVSAKMLEARMFETMHKTSYAQTIAKRARAMIEAAGLEADENEIEAVTVASTDSMVEKSDALARTVKRVKDWNAGAVKNVTGRNTRPGALTTFQQAPGWCYANAATAMHRYYAHSGLRQCDLATRNCALTIRPPPDCCAGMPPDGLVPDRHRPPVRQDPTNDFRMAGRNTKYHMQYSDPKSCCGAWGIFIPDTHTSGAAFGTIRSYGANAGKSWGELKAAINANKPFIMASEVHYYVCYGYIQSPSESTVLCHDSYYHHGGKTGEVRFTYQQYFAMGLKTHYND